MLRCGIALLLLIAAALKAWGGWSTAHDPNTSIPTALVVLWEVFLAAWLVTGFAPGAVWVANFATFSVFAGVALRTALQGSVNCGCFGRVSVNPWAAFGLDVGVLSLLLLNRPVLGDVWRDGRSMANSFARPALVAAVILGLVTVGSGLAFGSWRGTLARLRGEAVGLDRDVYDTGRQAAGGEVTFHVSVSNWSGQPVMVYGGSNDCSHRIETPLPVTLGPGETVTLSIELLLPEAPGVLRKRFHLLTDHPQARRIGGLLTCAIAAVRD